MLNSPPILVYLAYKFSGDATENTKEARRMAITLMKHHLNWFVLLPHYAIDAMLDGTIDWGKYFNNFTEWRRTRAGMMSIAFVMRCDIMVLGCKPDYQNSHGVTWEHIVARVMNLSYRKDNPIKIITYKEAMK